MKKRLLTVLSVILTFLMLVSTSAFAANVDPVQSDNFTDVSASDWFKEYVDFVASNGYMIGTSETTFEPQSNLTRAMFATILARYDKADVDDSKATIFNDVPVDQWYTGSIGWSNEKSIVQGYGDGNFGTNDAITRQDLSLMIIRYIRYYEKEHNVEIKVHGGEWNGDITFTDEDQIRQDEETPAAIKALVNYGVLLGYPDGTVKPTQNITRAETAAIMKRLDWVIHRDDGVTPGTDTFKVRYYDADNPDPVKTVTVYKNQNYTVKDSDILPTKLGVNFKEWNTKKDGSGDAYMPGDKILIKGDVDLYAICEVPGPKTQDYYQVTATLKPPAQLTDSSMELQTPKYTEEEADAMTMDDAVLALISGDNKDAIVHAVESAIEKVKNQRYENDNYIVTISDDGVIKAEKKTADGLKPVNLEEELNKEKAVYDLRMTEIKGAAAVTSSKWDDMAEKYWVGNMFDFADPYAPKLLENGEAYYNAILDAVNASIDLHKELKDSGYDFAAGVKAVADWAKAKGIEYNNYTINEGTVTDPLDIMSGTRVIGALNYDTGIIIDVLGGEDSHVVIDATETIPADAEAFMNLINARTSLDLRDHKGGFEAILESIVSNGKLLGDYNVKVEVKKITE